MYKTFIQKTFLTQIIEIDKPAMCFQAKKWVKWAFEVRVKFMG